MFAHFITEICFFGLLKQCQPCMGKHIIADFDVSIIHTRLVLQAIWSYQSTLKVYHCFL
jgi:hypothetical protein